MFRLLTTEVLWHGIMGNCCVITYAEGTVTVAPFEKELHSTIFVPGPIAILNSLKFDEFVLDDIEMLIGNVQDTVAVKKKLDDFFKSSGLYYCNGFGSEPVFLKLGRQCQIIPIN